MRYLRTFDPWKGNFCTCRPKYSLAPYTGCDHKCQYCYITTYIPNAFSCRQKKDFIKNLPNDLKKVDNSIPISISNSSDPYPTIEKENKLTRETLKLLNKFNFRILLVTKSDLVVRDFDIITEGNIAVTMTINNINDNLSKRLEPNAPPPRRRLIALEKLILHGIPVMVRVDPIIPGLNEDVRPLLIELRTIGVNSITTSTYKARHDSIKRLVTTFPELETSINDLYLKNGEYINNSKYLAQPERLRIMKNVKDNCDDLGLGFNMCREGLTLERTSGSCDGAHLLD